MTALSRPASEALTLLGLAIRQARQARRMTIAGVAMRLGISPPTLIAIEKGNPRAKIGSVFEAAILLNVPLFDQETKRHLRERQALTPLLPRRIRQAAWEQTNADQVPDDF